MMWQAREELSQRWREWDEVDGEKQGVDSTDICHFEISCLQNEWDIRVQITVRTMYVSNTVTKRQTT